MMGEQAKSEGLFYYFKLEEHVPHSHLLRLIDRYVDFGFLRSVGGDRRAHRDPEKAVRTSESRTSALDHGVEVAP